MGCERVIDTSRLVHSSFGNQARIEGEEFNTFTAAFKTKRLFAAHTSVTNFWFPVGSCRMLLFAFHSNFCDRYFLLILPTLLLELTSFILTLVVQAIPSSVRIDI